LQRAPARLERKRAEELRQERGKWAGMAEAGKALPGSTHVEPPAPYATGSGRATQQGLWMLQTDTTRSTRAAPQSYEEALAALESIVAMAKPAGERSRPATEFHPGQGASTLMDEWERWRSAFGSLCQESLMDQFHSVTPGAIALRRLRHLRQVVGWIRKWRTRA
jgi:hypothetical protein